MQESCTLRHLLVIILVAIGLCGFYYSTPFFTRSPTEDNIRIDMETNRYDMKESNNSTVGTPGIEEHRKDNVKIEDVETTMPSSTTSAPGIGTSEPTQRNTSAIFQSGEHVIESTTLLDYIHKQCEKHNFRTTWREPDSVTMADDQPRMVIVMKKYNFLYSSNPKSGSTSFKKFILRLQGSNKDYADMRGVHAYRLYTMLKGYAKSRSELTYKEILDSFKYKIGFIRNPITRIISGFRNKVLRASGSGLYKEVMKNVTNKDDSDEMKFQLFLKLLVAGKIRNLHFVPQYDKMKICSFPYDLLGQTETTSEQIQTFQNMTGTTEFEFPGSRTAIGQDAFSSVSLAHRYFDGVDPETMEGFYQLYKWDFELTGYAKLNNTNFPYIDLLKDN